jgi:hypothetical protein
MDISQVLSANYVGESWRLVGNDYSGLEWFGESQKPTEGELLAQWDKLQKSVEGEAQSKEEARLSAYEKLSGWGLTPAEIAAIIPA